MSEKKAKEQREEIRKEEQREETVNKPIGQIVIDVFADGSVNVPFIPPDLKTCMHIMAEAMSFCAIAFATQGQVVTPTVPPPPKERNRIVTMGGRR